VQAALADQQGQRGVGDDAHAFGASAVGVQPGRHVQREHGWRLALMRSMIACAEPETGARQADAEQRVHVQVGRAAARRRRDARCRQAARQSPAARLQSALAGRASPGTITSTSRPAARARRAST
jgi:hypothetical protein